MKRILIALFLILFLPGYSIAKHKRPEPAVKTAQSGLLKQVTFQGKNYLVCEGDPHQYKIETLNQLENGKGIYTFAEIEKHENNNLIFAINGGMYEQNLSPVGLFISAGKVYKELNLNEGTGNFYQLKPNGVFMLDDHNNPFVITSQKYAQNSHKIKMATQSGPMLVIDGALNANFKDGSPNLNIRNGVGVNKKGNVVLVISTDKVNFYEFAQLFKSGLDCDNALYLDGVISQYYAPELQSKPQPGQPLGTFITVSRHAKKAQ